MTGAQVDVLILIRDGNLEAWAEGKNRAALKSRQRVVDRLVLGGYLERLPENAYRVTEAGHAAILRVCGPPVPTYK